MNEKFLYFLILQNPSADSAKNACNVARGLNIRVTGQTGTRTIEVLATTEEAERLFTQGLFSYSTRRLVSPEHSKDFDPELKKIVNTWNARFSKKYLNLKKDKSKTGLKWISDGKKEPLPYSAIDPKMLFDQYLGKQKKGKAKEIKMLKPGLKINTEKIGIKEIELTREFLSRTLKNELLAEQVLGIFSRTPSQYLNYFLDPESLHELLEIIRHLLLADEPECLKMSGRNSVGIVFVESSRAGGPTFTEADRDTIENEIRSGLSFLVGEHPSGDLTWIYNVQRVQLDIANKPNSKSTDDSYWRNPAIGAATFEGHTFTPDDDGIDAFRDAMRAHQSSQHATVIFICAFGMHWHAYSSGRRYIAMGPHGDDWGGWGIDCLNAITAHEMCHQFGAADEYTGSGTPCNSCGGAYGCEEIPNGNCASCAAPHEDCIMDANDLNVCQYTRGHIGWCDIFVELWTDTDSKSGTNDDVWLDIGYRTFTLDTRHDDREKGNREGYALWAGGNLSREEIKRILIRKSSDGASGGWKLAKIKVYHDGETICDQSPHVWLENFKCWYLVESHDNTLVNTLNLTVATADVSKAGTDDDVTLKLAGRGWNVDSEADDFERGSTRSYNLDPQTGFDAADVHTITIQKSSDGASGGWKLRGLTLKVNGNTVYNNQSINKWLEDDDLIFTDNI